VRSEESEGAEKKQASPERGRLGGGNGARNQESGIRRQEGLKKTSLPCEGRFGGGLKKQASPDRGRLGGGREARNQSGVRRQQGTWFVAREAWSVKG